MTNHPDRRRNGYTRIYNQEKKRLTDEFAARVNLTLLPNPDAHSLK